MEFILIFMIWNFAGALLFLLSMSLIHPCDDETAEIVMDELNPVWQYKTCKVNWFGAIFLSIIWNLMCPIISIGYWFYKLCVMRRKN